MALDVAAVGGLELLDAGHFLDPFLPGLDTEVWEAGDTTDDVLPALWQVALSDKDLGLLLLLSHGVTDEMFYDCIINYNFSVDAVFYIADLVILCFIKGNVCLD